VELPLRAVDIEDRAAAVPAAVRTPRTLAGVRALIVDDEADARDLARYVLESRGAAVVVSASAGEALDLLANEPFAVLVADIGMPQQDGFALIRALRSLPGGSLNRDVPAIALTAYTSERERDDAIAAGFTTHLGKPVDPEQLIGTIFTVLGRVEP
jgi:CheY-like chemotaxis protein